VRWCPDVDFLAIFCILYFSASRVQHVADLHPKFALRPPHVCKYGDIQLATAEIRRKKKEEETTGQNIMSAFATQGGHKKKLKTKKETKNPTKKLSLQSLQLDAKQNGESSESQLGLSTLNTQRNTAVCLSVCLSVCEDISGTTRAIFTNFSVLDAYRRGLVLLRQGYEIQRGHGSFGIFLPH